MSRLLVMIVSFSMVIAAATSFAWIWQGEASIRVGRDLDDLRRLSRSGLAIRRPSDFRMVWMGDSSMVSVPENPAYEEHVALALGPSVNSLLRVRPGLNFYHHYSFMGDALEFEPDLVVANVTLRLLDPSLGHPLDALPASIPNAEISRAIVLPFYAVSLTIPRMLLFRLLRFPEMEAPYQFLTGLRQRFHDAYIWKIGLGDSAVLEPVAEGGTDDVHFVSHDREIARGDPMLRMISASVDLAVRNGAEVLIVVSPIPWQRLQGSGLYGRTRAMRRIALIRDAVESAGGMFVDLHDRLAQDEFSDSLGHVTATGNWKIKQALLPVVREMLGSGGRSDRP